MEWNGCYITDIELRGSLFEGDCTTGATSSTSTTMSHLKAPAYYKKKKGWILGELLDRHEFLIILPTDIF
jgi:hypothetical protein